ncbi:MAG: hypothetical protein AMS17_20845 [Spirochaetes bacterium DG_61]|nr:MAG: hypothetical protein AMS17_20845 [Spirochaetes bacterium DG_61]
MNMKRLIIIVAVVAMMAFSGSMLFAQYDIDKAVSDIQEIAVALSNVFGPNLGGMSFIGDPVGYSFIPRFEFGVAGGAVLVPLEDVTTGTRLDLDIGGFARLPIPAVAAHGKFSIGRIEIGGKIAGIPEIKDKDVGAGISNIVIGGKVRYRLLNFKTFGLKGGASVGGFYEYMKGYLALTQSESMPVDIDDDGTPEGTLTNAAGFETNWNANTFGGEAQANLQLLLFNLFAGTRVSKSFGKAETTIAGSSDLTGGAGITTGSTTLSISEESKPDGIDMFLYGGAEVKILILTVTGRVGYNLNNKNYTIDGGLRMQF